MTKIKKEKRLVQHEPSGALFSLNYEYTVRNLQL